MDVDHRLSPLEFLAQLKKGMGAAKAPPPALPTADVLASLDFSDLAAAAPASAPAGKKAGSAPSATNGSPSNSSPSNASLATPSREPSREKTATSASATETQTALPEPAPTPAEPPTAVKTDPKLSALFDRVNTLLGPQSAQQGPYFPPEPTTIEATNLSGEDIERLILKYLLARGTAVGRRVAQQLCLPFNLMEPLFMGLKKEQLVVFKGTATMNDYEYALTELGRERARRYVEECTYFGAAPVCLKDYLGAMAAQSIAKQHATQADLEDAFSDLIINKKMLDKLGPAINSGRGMFLFGEPGNGKTSIAERVTNCFGSSIWIPRALGIDGDIIRVFDPAVHATIEEQSGDGLFNLSGVDQRWVQIRRPTVIVGGELTMAELEVKQNSATKICEAPLQLKSNCGTLVIDDFGRQRMPVAELLNRWIVPLEKRYDFLNLPCGKKIQVPFDQIIIFSTNLEPRDLVDGAFLRRIPYKIQVLDPSHDEFHRLFKVIAPTQGFQYDKQVVDYLIDTHYTPIKRPFRACQPRDLLLQVRNYCLYHNLPKVMTPQGFDFACENYFSVM